MESVQLSHSGSTTHSSSIPGMFSPDRSSHVNSTGSIADDQPRRASNREERFTSWVADHRLNLEQRILGDRAERRDSRLPGRPAPSHSSLRDAAASQYAPRGPYVPIELQSAAAGSSGEARSHARSERESHGTHSPLDPEDLRCRQSFVSRLREKRLRRRLITLVISACFLILVIAIYLAFAASRTTLGRELQILLIFMILILGIVFCHSLTRFLMALLRRPGSDVATNRIPSRAGPAGYAQPARPIHVILAGDEDVGAGSPNAVREKVTAPPPAYGLWRESVRINPDLLYWQRIENNNTLVPKSVGRHGSNKSRIPRPPSYTSDNGVDYVIEAQPRSFTQWRIPEESGHQP